MARTAGTSASAASSLPCPYTSTLPPTAPPQRLDLSRAPRRAPEVAADQDRERKPVCSSSDTPQSKLVRNPGSFVYRRLLPFLNEMAKNNFSNGVDTSSLDDGYVDMGIMVPLVLKAGTVQEMKDCCDTLKEESKIVPFGLASSKPPMAYPVTRSRIVHHPSSFSYKRMLPFLMDNEISSQQGDRIKFQRISKEKQLTSEVNDILACGHHHLDISKDSPVECNRAEDETIVEEKTTISDDFCVLSCGQLQSTIADASPDGITVEVLKVTQEVLASDGDTLSSHNADLASDSNNVLFGG